MSAMSRRLPWAFQAVSAPPLSASGPSNEGNSAICGDGASVGVCEAVGAFPLPPLERAILSGFTRDIYAALVTAGGGHS